MEIMGILNATPDSFYDGGRYSTPKLLLEHALKMINEGAKFIDIGGESTRPGFIPVSEDEELERVIPVIKLIHERSDVILSIDTTKPGVAKEALKAGCSIINDVSGKISPQMVSLAIKHNSRLVIMHNSITDKRSLGIVFEMMDFFKSVIDETVSLGLGRDKIILDPGIGFSKNVTENFEVLNNLSCLKQFGLPVLLAASNKSYISKTIGTDEKSLIIGNTLTTALAQRAGVDIIRVHDVSLVKKVKAFFQALN